LTRRSHAAATIADGAAIRAAVELFGELLTLNCPNCDARVGGMYLYPTAEEIREAAAAGNPRAIAMLPETDAREQRWQRIADEELRKPGQLADIAGDAPFVVRWSLERADDEHYVVLRAGEQIIGRELAIWEGLPRFKALAELLRERYGRRVTELRPDDGEAVTYLLGDKLSWVNGIEETNAGVFGTTENET
jgi:hypothetical protein